MMLKYRAIRRSLYDYVSSLFTSPPPATGWREFNVYGENELRRARRGTFTPVEPYIYILDSYAAPSQAELPLIVVELSIMTDPYQLGDASGRFCVCRLHAFGRNRGERDDISSMLQDVFAKTMLTSGSVTPFPIYDYHASGSTTFIETAHINSGIDISPEGVGEDASAEGSTLNWNQVSFTFRTKS